MTEFGTADAGMGSDAPVSAPASPAESTQPAPAAPGVNQSAPPADPDYDLWRSLQGPSEHRFRSLAQRAREADRIREQYQAQQERLSRAELVEQWVQQNRDAVEAVMRHRAELEAMRAPVDPAMRFQQTVQQQLAQLADRQERSDSEMMARWGEDLARQQFPDVFANPEARKLMVAAAGEAFINAEDVREGAMAILNAARSVNAFMNSVRSSTFDQKRAAQAAQTLSGGMPPPYRPEDLVPKQGASVDELEKLLTNQINAQLADAQRMR